jgi:sucrose-6-phosphate hydrolase SacC (GH32 family)
MEICWLRDLKTLQCPVCNGSIQQNTQYGYDAHTHELDNAIEHYVCYTMNGTTQVKRITYAWDRLPSLTSNTPLRTTITTIITLDGYHLMTMERVEKLLLLK